MLNRIPVTVHIKDENDNFPEFIDDNVEVSIVENIEPGEIIATVQAVDKDAAAFGSQGIRYTTISGSIR